MTEVGIRALKQNASAVVAEAAAGETVTITDRGRPVARMTAIPASRLQALIDSGTLDRHDAAPDRLVDARAVLDAVTLIEVTTAIFETARRLEPMTLRSLDALHVSAALDLGDDLEGLVTYDERLADGAASNGISVVSPS